MARQARVFPPMPRVLGIFVIALVAAWAVNQFPIVAQFVQRR